MYDEHETLDNATHHTWDETWEGAGELWYGEALLTPVRYALVVHVTQLRQGTLIVDEGLQIDGDVSRLWVKGQAIAISPDRWYELRLGAVKRERGAPATLEVLLQADPDGGCRAYRIRLYRQSAPTDVQAYLFPE